MDQEHAASSAPNGNGQEARLGELRVLQDQFRSLENTAALLDRLRFARMHGQTFNGQRDEYVQFGYDAVVTYRQYRDEYLRGGIAGRVIDVMPNACWRGEPPFELIEDEDPNKSTAFEKAWKDLDKKHEISSKLQRTDKLSLLSTYAVILLGAAGDWDTELPKLQSPTPEALLYLMPFSGGGGPGSTNDNRTVQAGDAACTIYEWEENTSDPRFGLPKLYTLKRTNSKDPKQLRPVHWSRVIHVPAEGLLEDEVFGLPGLERVWNLFVDLRKVTGGGAEAFWLRANAGLHVNVDKDLALSAPTGNGQTTEYEAVLAKLREDMEAYKHNLTRFIRTRGVEINQLGSDVANFAAPADAIITQIAGSRGIPKRILTGSEMGELASSQDRENFKDQVVGRQQQHCAPIVRRLADRLIDYGYLPKPNKGPREYQVKWPHIQVLTEAEKATGALQWAQTKVNEDPVYSAPEIREKWYGMAPMDEEQLAEIDARRAERQQQNIEQQQTLTATKQPALRAAEEDAEMVDVLVAAIQAKDTDLIHRILNIEKRPSTTEVVLETLKALGGPGSGNFGHAGRPGEIGGSASEGGVSDKSIGSDKSAARARFKELKAEWAHKNNDLFKYIDHPDSPEARAHLDEMKTIVKEMHTLDADPGGLEGIGLPGGPRDVVIIGGGPGGLSASINGAAEGYDTLLVEGSEHVGGQARQSTRIENLPGFPLGVSGERLATSMQEQSLRLGAEHKLGVKAVGISYDPDTDIKTITLSNGETIEARTVVLSGGLSFANKAPWDPGSDAVTYADPDKLLHESKNRNVVVAGGSNGAAQAAIACAENGAERVTLISRSNLDKSMSDYQLNQVRNHPRITPIVSDIKSYENGKMTLSDGRSVAAERVGVFYGAAPDTKWMAGTIQLDKGRVVTSHSHDFQTSMPGVFAVGDITHNAAGRIGVAIGEGQQAIKGMYAYFESLRKKSGTIRRVAEMRVLEGATKKRASDIRVWHKIVDIAFGLDHALPWYGQTVEGEKLPRHPARLSAKNERKIRVGES